MNNPKIIDLFNYKFYGGPHKSGINIVNYNPRRTHWPLVTKQYTFNATKPSHYKEAIFRTLKLRRGDPDGHKIPILHFFFKVSAEKLEFLKIYRQINI